MTTDFRDFTKDYDNFNKFFDDMIDFITSYKDFKISDFHILTFNVICLHRWVEAMESDKKSNDQEKLIAVIKKFLEEIKNLKNFININIH